MHCYRSLTNSLQVSNYFAPTDKAKQDGFNAYLTDKNAERLATALCRMRGAALKLGQMLSIQDEGVLPPQVPAHLFIHHLSCPSLDCADYVCDQRGESWRRSVPCCL